MLDRRSFLRFVSAASALTGATAASARTLKPRPISLIGAFVSSVDSDAKTLEVEQHYETWEISTNSKTKVTVKTYKMVNYHRKITGTRKGTFADVEEDFTVDIKGKLTPNTHNVLASSITVYEAEYGY